MRGVFKISPEDAADFAAAKQYMEKFLAFWQRWGKRMNATR